MIAATARGRHVRGLSGSTLAQVLLQFGLGRVLPAWLLGFMAAAQFLRLQRALAQATPGSGPTDLAAHYAWAGYEALGAVFLAIVAALFLVRKPSVRKLPRLAPQVVGLAGAYILSALTIQPVTLSSWWVPLVANLLMLAGVAGMLASLLVLGRCFGILPEARGLVTSGPYRHVRHPLYTAEALTFLGMLVPKLSPLSLAIYAAYLALTLLRARYEEEVLLAAFPEYAAYRRSTRRFVPRLF